jgi:signal transduction histidine kinase
VDVQRSDGPRIRWIAHRAGFVGSILTAAVTLVLLVGALATFRSDVPYYGFEITGVGGHVTDVDVYGPAADIGLRVTDRVVAINGVPIFRYLVLPYDSGSSGRHVLTYRRGAETVEARIEPLGLTPRERAFNFTRLFIGLVFWIVGITVWALRPSNRVRRLFFLMGQLVAAMLFLDVMDPTFAPAVLGSDALMLLLGPMVAHFCSVFPHPISGPARRWLIAVGYGGAAVLAAVSLAAAPLVPALAASATLPGVEGAFAIAMLCAGVFLLIRPQRDVPLDVRRRRRVVITGMLLGVAPVLLLTRLPLLLTNAPVAPYEATVPFLALVPLAYAYAFFQGELGTTDFILNRTLVYLLLTTLLVGLYGSMIYALGQVFPVAESTVYVVATMAVLVLSGVLFTTVRSRLQGAVDRLFYGGWYDYRTIVRGMSEELSRSSDRASLVERLATVSRTMRFESGALFWPVGDVLEVAWASGTAAEQWKGLQPSIEGGFVHRLLAEDRLTEGALSVSPDGAEAFDPLPEPGRAAYWLPLVCDGRLRGVLVMADRQADEMLGREDVDILHTLSRQAAVAAANVHLLEDLETRLAEVEAARDALAEAQHRLGRAREAERAHLARELHDGSVQDLYAIGHCLDAFAATVEGEGLDALVHLKGMARTSAERLRGICMELRPPFLEELGFETALRAYAAEFSLKNPEIHLELRIVGGDASPGADAELAVFRICQEALNNIAAHAGAEHVTIAFQADARRSILVVEDDGCGFVIPDRWSDLERFGHLGLMGMAERVELLGGVFEVFSNEGEGTTIRTSIPRAEVTA